MVILLSFFGLPTRRRRHLRGKPLRGTILIDTRKACPFVVAGGVADSLGGDATTL
jgi:hypothetical protein